MKWTIRFILAAFKYIISTQQVQVNLYSLVMQINSKKLFQYEKYKYKGHYGD